MKILIIGALVSICLLAIALLASCQASNKNAAPNQQLAAYVDLERFMGTWYVHGYTPTRLDRDAYNATETYKMEPNGKIKTTYRFRKGSLDGPEKTYNPTGAVYDKKTNAEWRMRFFGIINAPYYIVYVDDAYQYCVIGHPNKKLAWIMSRSREIGEEAYGKLRLELETREYELSELQRVTHSTDG